MGGTELKVLKALRKKGGEATPSAIAREIKMSTDYTRIVCRGLGMDDYVDVAGNGRITLTNKGIETLHRFPPEPGELRVSSGKPGEVKPVASAPFNMFARSRDREMSSEQKFRFWTMGEKDEPAEAVTETHGDTPEADRTQPVGSASRNVNAEGEQQEALLSPEDKFRLWSSRGNDGPPG